MIIKGLPAEFLAIGKPLALSHCQGEKFNCMLTIGAKPRGDPVRPGYRDAADVTLTEQVPAVD